MRVEVSLPVRPAVLVERQRRQELSALSTLPSCAHLAVGFEGTVSRASERRWQGSPSCGHLSVPRTRRYESDNPLLARSQLV